MTDANFIPKEASEQLLTVTYYAERDEEWPYLIDKAIASAQQEFKKAWGAIPPRWWIVTTCTPFPDRPSVAKRNEKITASVHVPPWIEKIRITRYGKVWTLPRRMRSKQVVIKFEGPGMDPLEFKHIGWEAGSGIAIFEREG